MNMHILFAAIPLFSLGQIYISKSDKMAWGWFIPVMTAILSGKQAISALQIVGPRLQPDYFQALAWMLPSVWYLLVFFLAYYYRRR